MAESEPTTLRSASNLNEVWKPQLWHAAGLATSQVSPFGRRYPSEPQRRFHETLPRTQPARGEQPFGAAWSACPVPLNVN